MEVAHIDAWRRDPDRFWGFYADRFVALVDKQPNAAHHAVAELERRGLVKAVITQNIDRLHRLAGTRRLIEVHGSIEWSVCMRCGGKVALERVIDQLRTSEGAPECPACIAPLKPDVVLFGENVPKPRVDEAWRLYDRGDILLVVGSSLTVYSGRRFVYRAQQQGRPIVVLNMGPTRADELAAAKLEDPLGVALPRVADALLGAVR
jgi:NAD-dependent deacetylase